MKKIYATPFPFANNVYIRHTKYKLKLITKLPSGQ